MSSFLPFLSLDFPLVESAGRKLKLYSARKKQIPMQN